MRQHLELFKYQIYIATQRFEMKAKLVQLINAMEPDIIVFTGDSINTPAALPLFKNTMSSLNAKLAKIACPG